MQEPSTLQDKCVINWATHQAPEYLICTSGVYNVHVSHAYA